MTDPLSDLVAPERHVEPTRRPLAGVWKVFFTVALLTVGGVVAVLGGELAVKGIANAYGVSLDAEYCDVSVATQCSSVSLGQIDRVSEADLPEGTTVVDSSWSRFLLSARLHALVRLPDDAWTPPATEYEPCAAPQVCAETAPDAFSENGVTLSEHYVPNPDSLSGTSRELLLGRDEAGNAWVLIQAWP
jgi:hypothetical protein